MIRNPRACRALAALTAPTATAVACGKEGSLPGAFSVTELLGTRKTQVMSYVLVPQAVRSMPATVISQSVVAVTGTLLGRLITYEEFLHADQLIASNLDYDLPFIPAVMVISPICIGMCMLLSWFAPWVFRREQRSPKTEAVNVAPAEPGTLLPGGGPPTAPRL